jgi:Mg2+ and Co2+ transporter CorA
MGNPRADVLLALEEVLCAREEVRSATGARRPEPLSPHLPDLETQIIELVRADRSRTTAVLQQAIDQLEQLDARMSRSEERAREAEELLQHLYKCTEAQNEAKDMLGQLYRRIEAQLTGKSNRYARGAPYGRSAA